MCALHRERELSRVREEQRAKFEAELRQLRRDLEDKHQRKMDSIRKMELDSLDRLKRRERESEAAMFSKRQELERQLQAIADRDAEVSRERETVQHTYSLAEQKIAVMAEQISAREKELYQYKDQLEAAYNERTKK